MLEGQGGNIAVSVGDDGVLIVDDQFAPLSEKILAAIAALSDHPVSFVINTHHHGDHSGGNANMAATGATIVAHQNARDRIRANFEAPAQGEPQPVPAGALPTVTFSEDVTFHFNGEEIRVHHVAPAHTDGDSFVHFVNANVIHTGDVFRTTSYPAADGPGGGSFVGILDAYRVLLDMAGPETKIMPGHGVVSTEAEVTSQLGMIESIRGTVAALKGEGQSLEQVIAAKPSSAYDERWAAPPRWTGDYVVTEIYNSSP
jgi:glyoxylase-like metal-dependent hydrolase (beta-lactamase superfamily II)